MPSLTSRILFAAVTFVAAAAILACSGSSDPSDTPSPLSPTPDVETSPTPRPRQGPTADGPTGPGPRSGGPCPVEQAICDFAQRVFALVDSGNLDGLLALSEPVSAACPAGGLGGPSAALCAGAAPGELRFGYWDVQGGEGLVVTESEWRRTLGRWFASIDAAQGSDVYGSGELKVGAISCTREAALPSGGCGLDNIRVHLTFINSPAGNPANGTGIPGQRVSVHFSTHRSASGGLKIEGFGTAVPPNTALLAFETEAVDRNGKQVVIEYYPWTP